jgi:hypothetical protein
MKKECWGVRGSHPRHTHNLQRLVSGSGFLRRSEGDGAKRSFFKALAEIFQTQCYCFWVAFSATENNIIESEFFYFFMCVAIFLCHIYKKH